MGDDLRFVSSAYLLASHDYLNQKCQSASDAFMRCKAKDQDPAACYKLGNELSACGAKMYDLIELLKDTNNFTKSKNISKNHQKYPFDF
jgi:hypothetical protein